MDMDTSKMWNMVDYVVFLMLTSSKVLFIIREKRAVKWNGHAFLKRNIKLCHCVSHTKTISFFKRKSHRTSSMQSGDTCMYVMHWQQTKFRFSGIGVTFIIPCFCALLEIWCDDTARLHRLYVVRAWRPLHTMHGTQCIVPTQTHTHTQPVTSKSI